MTNFPALRLGCLLIAYLPGIQASPAEAFAVFLSADRGHSWERADEGLPSTSRVHAFAVVDGRLVAATDAGVFVTAGNASGVTRRDQPEPGQTAPLRSVERPLPSWRPVGEPTAVPGRVLTLTTMGTGLYAGTDGHGLWQSMDHGTTWTRNTPFSSPRLRCLLAMNPGR